MILGNRARYVHMMSLMERVLCHFLWDVGPMNVNINTLKVCLAVLFSENR